MQITAIDGTTLNGASDIRVRLLVRQGQARSVATRTQSRSYLPPRRDDVQFDAWTRMLHITRARGSALSDAEFDELVQGLFAADGRERTLTGEHDGVQYQLSIVVRSISRREVVIWEAEIEALDPYWQGVVVESGSSSPLTVGGNVRARPLITITDGDAVTHRAITVTSGRPLKSYPIAVDVSGDGLAESNYIVWHSGRRVPFVVNAGTLYLRIDTDIRPGGGHLAWVDVYSGASIDNTLEAGELEAAGLTLSPAINGGTVVADPSVAIQNPLSPALTWLPAQTVEHDSSRPYTYGLDGETVRLVDREETGAKEQLADNVDSLKLVSPLGMASISNLSLSIFAGYRKGRNAAGGDGEETGERVQRVIIQTSTGEAEAEGPLWPEGVKGTGIGDPQIPSSMLYSANDWMFYATFSFGGMTFPNTYSWQREGPAFNGTAWENDERPWDFPSLVAQFLPGASVTTGAPGIYYVHFPDGIFGGAELPLFSMSLQAKDGSWTWHAGELEGQTLIANGPESTDDLMLFEAAWVDPDTLEPFEDAAMAPDEPEQDLVGTVRAFVRAWYADAPENPVTIWSQVLRGGLPSGSTHTFSGLNLNLNGAVEVAIGLEPAAATPNQIDWGELEITSSPTITLAGIPTLTVQSVAAQHLNGTLVNGATGAQIAFSDVFSDDGGLEIDTSGQSGHEVVRGAGGVGRVYGFPLPSDGARWFDLPPGLVSWQATGALAGATISFSWPPRLAVDS